MQCRTYKLLVSVPCEFTVRGHIMMNTKWKKGNRSTEKREAITVDTSLVFFFFFFARRFLGRHKIYWPDLCVCLKERVRGEGGGEREDAIEEEENGCSTYQFVYKS